MRLRVLLLLLATALAAPAPRPASAGEPAAEDVAQILETYRKRFRRDAYLSEKEEILAALVARGGTAARDALAWCAAESVVVLEEREKAHAKVADRLRTAQKDYGEKYDKYAEQQVKQGKPRPTTTPRWPEYDALQAATAEATTAEKSVDEARAVIAAVRKAQGAVLDRLSGPDLAKAAEDVAAAMASKDWGVRAEMVEMLAGSSAPWAFTTLQDAAAKDPDPRVVAPALEALGGREPSKVLPILTGRLSDARWLVRAAALSALERTPSKETVDAVLACWAKEEGRLRDDCRRVLETLTAYDGTPTQPAWSQWWAIHRESWTGPPPKFDPAKQTPEQAAAAVRKRPQSDTGFFGISSSSTRLCYVIDLSGSMNEPQVAGKPETRAQKAKAELGRAIRALEDGAWFNVVLYSANVRVWKPEMQPSTLETRRAACEFIEKAEVVGGTATFDALDAALALGDVGKGKARGADPSGDAKLDTILLLSDGKPTLGKVIEPDRIRAAVRDLNRERRIAIHSIALGGDADASFMEGLATDHGGTYLKL
ncbi:MAG: hypothetical protein HMLKMBBP_02089 [Planctomycetes bacterium]|nr:hypothetical protein [Planctomycetota bacterium]